MALPPFFLSFSDITLNFFSILKILNRCQNVQVPQAYEPLPKPKAMTVTEVAKTPL